MRKNWFEKGLVFGVIVLLLGTGVIPGLNGNIEKLFLTKNEISTVLVRESVGNTGYEPWYYYIGGMINSGNGNLYLSMKDISVKARGFTLEVVRSYNSHNNNFSTGFGYGWTFSYNVYLIEKPDNSVILVEGDGSFHNFTDIGDGNYSSPPGIHSRLKKNLDDTFTLWFTTGMKYDFNSDGILQYITEKNGNSLTFTYSDEKLVRIDDDSGLYIDIDYNVDNRISTITDPLGREITYDYDDQGNLAEIRDPMGNSSLYFYNADHNLLSFVNRFGGSTNFNYTENKVREISLSLYNFSTGTFTSSYRLNSIFYEDDTVEVIGARGDRTIIQLNDNSNPTEIINGCSGTNTMAWDEDMNMVSSTDVNGNTYTFEYDAYGNVMNTTCPLGYSTLYKWNTIVSDTRYISLLINVTNARGNTTGYGYDERGNHNRTTDASGNSSYLFYDSMGNVVRVLDFRGYTTTFSYDSHGNMVNSTDATGNMTEYMYDVVGRLLSVTNANEHTVTNEYDDNDRLIQRIDTTGNVTRYFYNEEGSLIRLIDANGNQIEYRHNLVGRMDEVTDASGNETNYLYDTDGNLISSTDAEGGITNVTNDVLDRIISVTDALGNTESYTYDAVGNRLSLTDKKRNTTYYEYDTLNRLTKITDALGYETRYAYDALGNLINMTDANDHSTTYEYDELSRVVHISGPSGCGCLEQVFSYDANGNRISFTDANGQVTHYEYNALNRLIKIIDPAGNETTLTYDAVSNLIKITDRNNHTTSRTYDALNRVIQITDARGNSEYLSYDAVGNLKTYTAAKGDTTTYTYDKLNRVTKIIDATGNSTVYAYDALDNLISATDANGNTVTYSYDVLNRLITATDALNHQTNSSYDAVGNLIRITDANGHMTTYQYTAVNQLKKVIDPLNNEISYTYDGVGNLLSITDADGDITRYEYDQVNRLTKTISPLGFETQYSYDGVGNLINKIDGNGDIIRYEYDALNRLILTSYPDGSTVATTYDAEDNIIQLTNTGGLGDITYNTYDELDQLVSTTTDYGSFTKNISHTYDANGNRKTMTDPDGGITTYEYGPINRLLNITDPSNDVTAYAYDNAGRRIKLTNPNGVNTTYIQDAANRLLQLKNAKSTGEVISRYSYSYDAVGNRLSVTDATGNVTSYGYDAIYQLTNVAYPDGNSTYTYDGAGNRLTQTVNGAATSYTYDADNRLLSGGTASYSYDNNGNLISKTDASGATTYDYDYENRLTKVTLPDANQITYQYSGFGNRLNKTTTAGTTYYLYNDEDVLMELDAAGIQKARFTHGPGIDEPISMKRSGVVSYYHFDGLGSVTSLTNTTGNVVATYKYDVFGSLKEETGVIENPYRFTSREYDKENGLYYYRARSYDSVTGRFLQQDPIGYAGGLNLYSYVKNNPVNFFDPLGQKYVTKIIIDWECVKEVLRGLNPTETDIYACQECVKFCGPFIKRVPYFAFCVASNPSCYECAYDLGSTIKGLWDCVSIVEIWVPESPPPNPPPPPAPTTPKEMLPDSIPMDPTPVAPITKTPEPPSDLPPLIPQQEQPRFEPAPKYPSSSNPEDDEKEPHEPEPIERPWWERQIEIEAEERIESNGSSSIESIDSPPSIPCSPNPEDDATSVSVTTDISWTGGDQDSCDTVTHDIYFGTTNPPPKIVSNQSGTNYEPGALNYGTTYYWKIIAWDNHGVSASGSVWHFTTASCAHDVGVTEIISPTSGVIQIFTPEVVVKNYGSNYETFDVHMTIANTSAPVTIFSYGFEDWVPPGGTTWPYGWTQEGTSEWQECTGSTPGIATPSAYLPYYSIVGDYAWFMSPEVDTTGSGTLTLSYASFIDDYWYYMDYNCYVETRSSPSDSWTDRTPWPNPIQGNVGPGTYYVDITDDIGTGTQVRFVFSGVAYDIDYWFIDDVNIGGTLWDFTPATVPGHWPGWTQYVMSGTSPNNKWDAVSAGTNPTCIPPEGAWMARYQSFNIPSGNSNRLIKNAPFNFSGAAGYNLKFQMMHDTGYASSTDRITVCASPDGGTFYFMGTFNRYDGTTGWKTHSVDLSYFAGLPTVWIGFYAESFYGNNMFIDDINLEAIGLSYEYDQTVTTTLNSGETKNVVFPAWIPSDVSQYIVTACTLLIGDCNPSNDCISEIINLTLDTTPNTPTQPSGTTSGYICISYNYSTSTTDPDGDNVKYGWDWDDGSPIEWSDWYSSGDTCTMSHSWDDPGTYDVRVKAMDTWGNESGWSLQLTVIMANHPPNTPSNPNPTNGASNVDINADLSWTGGDPDSCDTVTYDVYFGTTSPPPKVVGNQSDTSYNPGTMNYNTHYYWKIVAWDNHSASTLGPLWSFTTKANTPPVFGTPSPINGSTNNPLSLSWSIPIHDPEGDLFSWTIQCSNGQVNSGTGATNGTKSLALSGLAYSTTYKVWVNATDPGGSGIYTRKWYTFTTQQQQNVPPNKPNKPSGTTSGEINTIYTYTTSTTDPNGDQVYYQWDWGDGSQSNWLGPYNSGVTISTTHKWTVKGSYSIKVKAKDTSGAESPWSDPLSITMPYSYNQPILQFLELLFERFPHAFPILRYLLGY